MPDLNALYCFAEFGDNPHEIVIDCTLAERQKFEALPYDADGALGIHTALIADRSGRLFEVRRADCGGDNCFCAAEARPVAEWCGFREGDAVDYYPSPDRAETVVGTVQEARVTAGVRFYTVVLADGTRLCAMDDRLKARPS